MEIFPEGTLYGTPKKKTSGKIPRKNFCRHLSEEKKRLAPLEGTPGDML